MAKRYRTLSGFWPFYLEEHRHPVNRGLHAAGSILALAWLGAAIALRQPWFLLAALVNGYLFAWVGHLAFERNRPATFRYPVKSFLCDWRLLWWTLTGRLRRSLEGGDATRQDVG